MEQYKVTGMSCAACSSRVEKAVSKVDGVEVCSVNLLTGSMGIEGSAAPESIINAVVKAGYGAALQNDSQNKKVSAGKEDDEDNIRMEMTILKKRLIWSAGFLVILMYLAMGHTMWGWPAPKLLETNPPAMALTQLLLAAIVMVINQKFFVSGFKSLISFAPNMDALVSIGSGAAFIYSTCQLYNMLQMGTASHLYFETAAMILVLITVGKLLEARSKGKTADALKGLMELAPKTARIVKDGQEIEVPVENVKKGDIFAVRPGESIPVDGIITKGICAVNEAALTGESIPVDKEIGDTVSAATINQSGYIQCEAVRVGEDTALAQIIKMVSDAAATKAPIAKVADKVSGIFVPVVIIIAIVTSAIWLFTGQEVGFALARGISVLVISCPCALGLATPVAIMVASGKGAKNGILFKTAASIEEMGRIKNVVVDKTGTVTEGRPVVRDLLPFAETTKEQLLQLAYSLEKNSDHPVAKAITDFASLKNLEAKTLDNLKEHPGKGLSASYEGKVLRGGNASYIGNFAKLTEADEAKLMKLSKEGKTTVLFALDEKILGIIAVADKIKEDSPKAIKELKNLGIKTVMLTGDAKATAEAVGRATGVENVISQVLPHEKEKNVRELKKTGKTAMIGDGINDAPALMAADVGVAIGAGTDIAIDAADVVLMNSSLNDAVATIKLGRAALRNIHQNLFWAFIYNIIGIPLAAGVLIPIFGLHLNPMIAAAAMSLSSFCVVTNALRLNFAKIKDENIDIQEEKTMKKTMKIEGMMCMHCEAAVKKALEAVEGVTEAQVSHENNEAIVTANENVSEDILKKAVEDKDYTVVEIK